LSIAHFEGTLEDVREAVTLPKRKPADELQPGIIAEQVMKTEKKR
jgi:hypothetical protein